MIRKLKPKDLYRIQHTVLMVHVLSLRNLNDGLIIGLTYGGDAAPRNYRFEAFR